MPVHTDPAALIVAITGLITVLVNGIVSIVILVRQGQARVKSDARDVKLHEIGQAVNGLSDKRASTAQALGFAEGEKAGGEAERAR